MPRAPKIEADVRPCPYCKLEARVESPVAASFYVACGSEDGCSATGPAVTTREMAVHAWNLVAGVFA